MNNLDSIKVHQFSLTTKSGESFNVFANQDYFNAIEDKALIELYLWERSFADFWKIEHAYRFEWEWLGLPLLVAFYPQERQLYLAGHRLGREMMVMRMNALVHEEQNQALESVKNLVGKVASVNTIDRPSEWMRSTYRYKLTNLLDQSDEQLVKLELKADMIARQLTKKIEHYRPTFFEKFSDYALNLAANYALIRVHMLKFLAVLPCLSHDWHGREVKRLLLEYIRRLIQDNSEMKKHKRKGQNRPLPSGLIFLLRIFFFIANIIPQKPLAIMVRFAVEVMAKRFIAGTSIAQAQSCLKSLNNTKRDATVDALGELVFSRREADEYLNKVLAIIEGMKKHYTPGECNSAGILRAHVSIKVSALCHDFKPESFDYTYQQIEPRLKKILLTACKEQVFVNVDAEHIHYRDLVLRVLEKTLLSEESLKGFSAVGIVLQAYLRDSAEHLQDIINLAEKRNLLMPVRLVKGAYWDAETIESEAHNFIAPQYLNKEETDLNFRQMAWRILENHNSVQLCIGSHNFLDHSWVEVLREEVFPKAPPIEHQCLHMTYEGLSLALAKMGYATRNYVPIGNLIVGMAYLVRRIMENSSQVGVLTMMRSHKKFSSFIAPEKIHRDSQTRKNQILDGGIKTVSSQFVPTRPMLVYRQHHFTILQKAYRDFAALVKGNRYHYHQEGQSIYSSSVTDLEIGRIVFFEQEQATKLISKHAQALKNHLWPKSPLWRISALLHARELMLLQRAQLAALISYEAGKTLKESLADVDEASDFIMYYAQQETQLQFKFKETIHSRGLLAVIAPWNFPLAIPCGMVSSALMAGNSVILKSAEQTPLIAEEMVRLFHRAGVPEDILSHAPGLGEVVGKALVNSPLIDGVIFTGSKDVGTQIFSQLAYTTTKHKTLNKPIQRKVITEMGGKNAIIITNNCDLDEALSGVLYSCFAHAGQKCSAASRLIIDQSIKASFLQRFIEAVKDIKVGKAQDFSTYINPLISAKEKKRVKSQLIEAIAEASTHDGTVHIDRSTEQGLAGHCLAPIVIELPAERSFSKNSFAQRELFAPVVHVIGYQNLAQAIEIHNSVDYALTAGVFSQSQDDLDYLCQKIQAGNIYLNRASTGARVGIEPFGGFKLSGTGPKAGGEAYLYGLHYFLQDHTPILPSLDWEGSDYDYIAPEPSERPFAIRLEKAQDALNLIKNKIEVLLGGEAEEVKVFAEQLLASKARMEHFYSSVHSNYAIPGQLSYNNKKMLKEAALMVCSGESLSKTSLAFFYSGLCFGAGVQIIATTNQAYQLWHQLVAFAHQAGFAKRNIDIVFSSRQVGLKALRDHSFALYFFDQKSEDVNNLRDDALSNPLDYRVMKEFIVAWDSDVLLDFERLWDHFVWTRSFAVNTMRHGAALSLDEFHHE